MISTSLAPSCVVRSIEVPTQQYTARTGHARDAGFHIFEGQYLVGEFLACPEIGGNSLAQHSPTANPTPIGASVHPQMHSVLRAPEPSHSFATVLPRSVALRLLNARSRKSRLLSSVDHDPITASGTWLERRNERRACFRQNDFNAAS